MKTALNRLRKEVHKDITLVLADDLMICKIPHSLIEKDLEETYKVKLILDTLDKPFDVVFIDPPKHVEEDAD